MISAIVVNSYYGSGNDNLSSYVDLILTGENSKATSQLVKVPMLKTGGVSTTLPPVGATAFVEYIDGNTNRPIAIGYIDSNITKKFVKDNITPRRPPTNLTR